MIGIRLILFALAIFAGFQSIDSRRIVGGRPAEIGEFPYQVSLRRAFSDSHFCGGSVVAPRWILTAGHCMFYPWGGMITAFSIKIVAGQNQLELTNNSVTRIPTRIILHPKFDFDTLSNDVALLSLQDPLPLDNPLISIAALNEQPLVSGTPCVVSGWGVQKFGSQKVSEHLLAAGVDVIDVDNCRNNYEIGNLTFPEGAMCAATNNATEEVKDACQGDSGGPLFAKGLQVGIVSTGNGCADPLYPGIYTDISQFYEWINGYVTKDPYRGHRRERSLLERMLMR